MGFLIDQSSKFFHHHDTINKTYLATSVLVEFATIYHELALVLTRFLDDWPVHFWF